MPLDQTILAIVPHQDDDRDADPQRGLDFLRVHQEAGIAGYGHGGAIGEGQLGRDRARQPNAHRGETIRDDAGVGTLRLVHACHPHLVCPDVGHDDIIELQSFAQIENDALRRHRKRGIVRVRVQFLDDGFTQRPRLRLRLRRRLRRNRVEPGANVADHAAFEHVMLVHFGRAHIDVDDLLSLFLVPQVRVVFDHVVADTNHDVGAIETAGDIIMRLQSDSSQR